MKFPLLAVERCPRRAEIDSHSSLVEVSPTSCQTKNLVTGFWKVSINTGLAGRN
jgi:hypothetical protein